MSNNLIEVRNLVKHFEVSKSVFSRNKKIVKAVDGISFDIKAGETLGLVGQSGCGKTTTARSLCLLDPKTSGSVNFYNPDTQNMESIDNIDEDGMRIFRRNMQMIFQDPYESLNPRWTIKDIIKEPLDIHNIGSFDEREEAVMEIQDSRSNPSRKLFKSLSSRNIWWSEAKSINSKNTSNET